MDDFKVFMKEIFNKIHAKNEIDSKIPDMRNSSFFTNLETGPNYTSTMKSMENYPQNQDPELTVIKPRTENDEQLIKTEKITKIVPPIEENIETSTKITNSTAPIFKKPSSMGQERNNVPVMGQNALVMKINREKNAAAIVHELVTEKFNNVLKHYHHRSLNRNFLRANSEDVKVLRYYNPSEEYQLNFLLSTDNENVETTFDDNVTDSSLSSSVLNCSSEGSEYDVNKFLYEALGENLNFLKSSNDESVDSDNISSLVSKTSNFTRKDENLTPTNQEVNKMFESEKQEKIMREISLQNEIILQISKALNFCKATKEFMSSTEQIEAEKILLVASCKKEILTATFNQMEFGEVSNTSSKNYYGWLELGEMRFSQKITLEMDRFKDFTEHFVCILNNGSTTLASDVARGLNGCVNFQKTFKFPQLQPDFEITLSIYCIRVRKLSRNYSHESKFHLNKKPSKTTCPSPKSLFNKVPKYKVLTANESQSSLRASGFHLWGRSELRLSDVMKTKFKLHSTPLSSSLVGSFTAKITSEVHLNNSTTGFLTIALKNDDLYPTWNRRWCLLEGETLKYWNYPTEENLFNPISILNLKRCDVTTINTVDRSICAKARTLLLPLKCNDGSVKNYLLSADTLNDLVEWKKQLNSVLHALIHWNCMQV